MARLVAEASDLDDLVERLRKRAACKYQACGHHQGCNGSLHFPSKGIFECWLKQPALCPAFEPSPSGGGRAKTSRNIPSRGEFRPCVRPHATQTRKMSRR